MLDFPVMIGQRVTCPSGSDRYAAVVTRLNATGRIAWVRHIQVRARYADSKQGHQDWEYNPNEYTSREIQIRYRPATSKRPAGWYQVGYQQAVTYDWSYHRDWSF
jgi:hypothetical protein